MNLLCRWFFLTQCLLKVRPDNIVTESDFLRTQESFRDEPSKIAINLTKRTRWDDGLDRGENPDDGWSINVRGFSLDLTDAIHVDELPGNSEMVRKWMKLGFIAPQPYGLTMNALPIYVEKERHPDLPHTTDYFGKHR